MRRTVYTHPSLPTPMASKFFPLRVLLSWRTGTASKFINFSDGGGEPSTQPFQPFFTAARLFRGCGGADTTERLCCEPKSSPSSGVRGLLDDVREVLEEMDGPGVESGVEGSSIGDVGGGVTDTDRCIVAIWMAGRARQKDEALAETGTGGSELVLA